MKKKVLVTGSTGMLGNSVARCLNESGQYDIYGLSRSLNPHLPKEKQFLLDITAPLSNQVNIVPDVIIHTAALTDLAVCEADPGLAERIHVQGSSSVAALGSRETQLFYISTDSVFNGRQGLYKENYQPEPLNVYARTKLMGELAVQDRNKGCTTIIRTNIYGFHLPMKNSLLEWAYQEWLAGKRISGFTNIIFNAVYVGQLASIIRFLIEYPVKFRILNVGSEEVQSKFDFLDSFRNLMGVDKNLLAAVESSNLQTKIARPKNTSLDTSLLSSFYSVPSFQAGVQQWIDDFKQAKIC